MQIPCAWHELARTANYLDECQGKRARLELPRHSGEGRNPVGRRTGHQTLINQALHQAMQGEQIEATLRRVIREELAHGYLKLTVIDDVLIVSFKEL